MPNQQISTSVQESQSLVSFIITYYNQPIQMLQECIDSILNLSLRSYEREILVVDDGSDVSPINELVSQNEDIIYLRQKNSGLSAARNKGIDVATGRYLQFVDADDRLIPASYELCLDIIRYHEHADMVMFNFSTIPQVETIPETVIPVMGSAYMRNHNIHGSACGYLFRKSILGELRFTPCIFHEDEEFTPQLLLRADSVYPTHHKAYFYFQHKGTITSKQDAVSVNRRLDDQMGVLLRLQALCDKMPHQDKMALERRIAQLTMDYIYNTIMMTRKQEALEHQIQQLYAHGLFPLPDEHYSTKYTWFRHMTNSQLGRSILLHTLPLLKKDEDTAHRGI